MQRAFGGYTLIEVMIFLAVSSVLLATTIVAVRGQEAHTEFMSGVNDLNTKVQQWIDQVANGLSGATADVNSSDYNCVVNNPSDPNSQPQLDTVAAGGGNARGANPDCIFLGKALQIPGTLTEDPNSSFDSEIVAYTIIGRRTFTPAGGIETNVNNLINAKPVAAIFPGVDLTEEYQIPNGVRVRSVKEVNPATGALVSSSHMAGLFTSFSGETISNGSMSVIGVQYPLLSRLNPRAGGVTDCLKLTGACGGAPAPNLWPLKKWEICLQSTRNDDRARLTLNSSNGFGVTTKLEISPGAGSPICN